MRSLLRLGGALLVGCALVLAGRAWSDTKKSAPRPQTRVGLLNLMHVINSYDKAHAFREELKEAARPYQERETEKNKKVQELTREAADPDATPEEKAALEKKIKALRRELEDNKTEGQQVLIKKQEEQLKALYRDIEEATRRYARAHDLELVLQYNDAVKESDFYSAANLVRKVQAGACMPLYVAPGMDISKEIIAELNEALRRRKEA